MKIVALSKMNYPHAMIPYDLPKSEIKSHHGNVSKPGAIRRGPWSPEEDRRLMEIISLYGPLNWVRISVSLTSRSPKQCRERYHQNLKPLLKRNPINTEEGLLIEKLVLQHGKKWAEIARHLPGRSDNAIKNWWNGGANRRRRALLIQNPVEGSSQNRLSNASSSGTNQARRPSIATSAGATPVCDYVSITAVNHAPGANHIRSFSPITGNLLPRSQTPNYYYNAWRRRLTGFISQDRSGASVLDLPSMPSAYTLCEQGVSTPQQLGPYQAPDNAYNTPMFGSPLGPVAGAGAHLKTDADLGDPQRLSYRYVTIPQPYVPQFMLQSPTKLSCASVTGIPSQPLKYDGSRNESVSYESGPTHAPYIPPYLAMVPSLALSTVSSIQNPRRLLELPASTQSCLSNIIPYSVTARDAMPTSKLISPLRVTASAPTLSSGNLPDPGSEKVSLFIPTLRKARFDEAADSKDSSECEEKKMCVLNLID